MNKAFYEEYVPEFTTFGVMVDPKKKDLYVIYATSPDGTVEVLDGPSDFRSWFEDDVQLYADFRTQEVRGKALGLPYITSFEMLEEQSREHSCAECGRTDLSDDEAAYGHDCE